MLPQMVSEALIPVPSYLLYTASGYHAVYPSDVDYSTLLSPTFAPIVGGGLFDGTNTNAEVGFVAPATTPPRSMLNPSDTVVNDLLGGAGKPVYDLLAANNAWEGWNGNGTPVYFIHCPDDDVVPFQNAVNAQKMIPGSQIIPVPAIPMIKTLLGTQHVAAYPTAMFAAFLKIDALK
jgi:pimeloyl-ACP methyl ester carboxylesterase